MKVNFAKKLNQDQDTKKEGEEGTPEMMEAMMEGGDIDIKDFPKTVVK